MRYVLRISLPDHPGSLSGVTGALGRAAADIVALEVVERRDGTAVDDVFVETGAEPAMLRARLEEHAGVIVEAIRPVRRFRRTDAAMELAAELVDEGRGAIARLVDGLPSALWASWAVAVARGLTGVETLAASQGAPSLPALEVPWLPLDAPRRLQPAEWMPPEWRQRTERGELALAVAPLAQRSSAVLLARLPGPRFLSSELHQLALLGHIAVASEAGGSERRPLARVGMNRARSRS